jgi:nudix-type nucleoside diphosphatase (YffH/AdpP family)
MSTFLQVQASDSRSLQSPDMTNRIRIQKVETLSDDWYVLKKTTFDFLRSDGAWQQQSRETYDRGNGATILLYNLAKRTVILTRQFRFPAYVNGHPGMLIEAPAGLLDHASPEERIKAEVEEETGYRVDHVRKILEAYMSPGSVTEKLYFFLAEYDSNSKATNGGGNLAEGEDIEVLELSIEAAMHAIKTGHIADAKTIMLLQHAWIDLFQPAPKEPLHAH